MTMDELKQEFFEAYERWSMGDYMASSGNTYSDLVNDFCNLNATSYEEYNAMYQLLMDGREDE